MAPRNLDRLTREYGPTTWHVYELLDRSLEPRGPDWLVELAGDHLHPGNVVLDAGCRNAEHVITFTKDYGAIGVGVDPVAIHVEQGLAAVEEAGLSARVTLHHGVMHGTSVTSRAASTAGGVRPPCDVAGRTRSAPPRRPLSPTVEDNQGHGGGRIGDMRLGIAHHYSWAVAVTASADHKVVDRRRMQLIEPGVSRAPIHHEGGPHLVHRSAEPLDDKGVTALVASVRASVLRAASAALDELATALPEPIVSMSLRAWPADFPEDIAVQRRASYESRADSVMYCQVLAELARERGWTVQFYNAKDVVDEAFRILGERADEVLHGPRAALGPPWSKDHRMALAATIVVTPRG